MSFRHRFSVLAHARLPFCNPIPPAKLDGILALLPSLDGRRVLDVGCGRGDLLVHLAERAAIHGVGLDVSAPALAEGRARIAARVPQADLELRQVDAAEYRPEAEPFDLVACIGGPFERIEAAFRALSPFLRPGGFLLWGAPYWQRPPPPEYLAFLGLAADAYTTHAANVLDGAALGLVPLTAAVASTDDWDLYEGTYAGSIERFVADNPGDPDAPAMLARIRPWRDAYLRFGRETLGFGLYLFTRSA